MEALVSLLGTFFGPWAWIVLAAIAGALTGYGIRHVRKTRAHRGSPDSSR